MWRWVQVTTWCLALFFASTITSRVEPDNIVEAAVILPYDLTYVISSQRVKIILEMAIERYQYLLPGKKIVFQYYDDGCKAEDSLKQAFKALDPMSRKCHIMFGPTCEFATAMVGRLLKFFTVPLLTTGALTHDFMKNKTRRDDEFFGVVRLSPSNFITIARSINALNAKFNWTRFVMLYKPDGQQEVSGEGTCKLMMETLVESFKSITTKMVYRAVNMDRLNDTKKILLEEIGVDYSDEVTKTCYNGLHTSMTIHANTTVSMIYSNTHPSTPNEPTTEEDAIYGSTQHRDS